MECNKEGIRLDIYLSQELEISRSKIQKLIKDQKITVNGKVVPSSYKTNKMDQISINDNLDYEVHIKKENIPINIIYEDNDLLIINKKSGMVVHPAPGHYTGTLVNALLYYYQIEESNILRPGIVHRLDKDTSGLMLVAKNEKVQELLSKMIAEKKVERKYLAIVDGVIKNDSGTIDAPIGRDPKNREKMMVTDQNAKEAITHFKVLERYKKNTLIECILDTGRTHQIRVHMKYIGYPIVNDPLYNKSNSDFGQMLHSYYIKLNHPITKKELIYEVEPPEEMKLEIEKLRKES